MSDLYKLESNDFVKGAVTAVIAAVGFAVFNVIMPIIQAPDFNVAAVDWQAVLSHAVSVAVSAGIAAFVGYIGKNFFTDQNGKVFGRIG